MVELRCVVCEMTERSSTGMPDYVSVSVLDGFSLCLYCRVKVRDRWLRDRGQSFGQVVDGMLREFFDRVRPAPTETGDLA